MNIINLAAGLGTVETVITIIAALALIAGGVCTILVARRKSAKKIVKAQQPA